MTEGIPGGYNGKIARVNLSTRSFSTEPVDALLCRKYLGGAGFISYFLLKELPSNIDPLSPENKLIFALGPLTGLMLPGSGRNCIGAKSPLTGSIAKSEVGECWGAELKRAGFDALIVEGKSEKPVYLWVQNGRVEIRDAGHLWGKTTRETQEAIRAELGDKQVRVSSIGPAGEKLVRFACIMNGLNYAAGRGGLGAVMGSKNLKAVSVRGNKAPHIAGAEKVAELRRWVFDNMRIFRGFQEFGTGATMQEFEETGNLPVRNFRYGLFPGVKNIDAETIKNTIRTGMDGCFACPVRCKKVVQSQEPYNVDPAYGGPEYETLAALGSNCGIDNLIAIAKANEVCCAYSIDTISTGVAVSFAMECFEKGLLTKRDTDGLELRFGSTAGMLRVVEMIAKREGIGDLLAEGVGRAAARIGSGASEIAMHVKGLEIAMHEPRIKPGLALGYMVNPHGADHCANMHDDRYVKEKQLREFGPLGILEPVNADDIGPRKVALFKDVQCKRIIFDALVLCMFFPYSYQQVAEVVSGVTGWDTGITEQLRVAERILTTARLFNVREGFSSDDDKLPRRFFEPKVDGVLSNKALDPAKMDKAKSYYYTLMGWDPKTGTPNQEKLEELGILLE